MFKNHLFILDLKIKKYKRIYIIPLSDYNYWNLMKSYAYLLGFLEK